MAAVEPVTLASKLPPGLPATKAREVGEMRMEGASATVTPTSLLTLPALLLAVRVKVWLTATVTLRLPLSTGVIFPPWRVRVLAPLTSQLRVVLPPPTGSEAGVAVKLWMTGGLVEPVLQAASSAARNTPKRSLCIMPPSRCRCNPP
jgi:hypothetical protein